MTLMTWTEKYATGIRSVDSQHQKLIAMLNELKDAMSTGKGNDVVGAILDGLVQYTVTHFRHEEQLFAKYGYVDAAGHKAEHDKLTQKVVEFRDRFKAGRTALSVTVLHFLCDWLNGHILGTDMKYVPYLKSKNAA